MLVSGERSQRIARQPVPFAIICQFPILEETRISRRRANPQPSAWDSQQTVDAGIWEGVIRGWLVTPELNAIEQEEAISGSNPQEAVGCLGERQNVSGCTTLRRPGCVMQLIQPVIAVDAEARATQRQREETDDPTATGTSPDSVRDSTSRLSFATAFQGRVEKASLNCLTPRSSH
jgi:hypothetical protein